MTKIKILLLTVLAASFASAVEAQGEPNRREVVVQRFRERSAEVVKQRLGLSDDQMAKLQAVNAKLDKKREPIFRREMQVRMELRTAMENQSTNQDKISKLMDEALKLQQMKLDLVREEQNELSKFMTATQRAQYFALQNALRQRVEQSRKGGPGNAGRRRPGPNGPVMPDFEEPLKE